MSELSKTTRPDYQYAYLVGFNRFIGKDFSKRSSWQETFVISLFEDETFADLGEELKAKLDKLFQRNVKKFPDDAVSIDFVTKIN